MAGVNSAYNCVENADKIPMNICKWDEFKKKCFMEC